MVAALLAASLLAAAPAASAKAPLTAAKAKQFAASVESEIKSERDALSLIGTNDDAASRILETTGDRLSMSASYINDYSFTGPSPTPALDSASQLDSQAHIELKKGKAGEKAALAHVQAALVYKKKALSTLDDLITTLPSGATTCEVTKPFQVFAVPQGYAGSYAEVYPHGIPHNAKNIQVSFIDLATGKAPAPEVFPGQAWTATVKGYQPDGKFVVHIDVTGTGFGKPDANVKNWKVVVTYDCP